MGKVNKKDLLTTLDRVVAPATTASSMRQQRDETMRCALDHGYGSHAQLERVGEFVSARSLRARDAREQRQC